MDRGRPRKRRGCGWLHAPAKPAAAEWAGRAKAALTPSSLTVDSAGGTWAWWKWSWLGYHCGSIMSDSSSEPKSSSPDKLRFACAAREVSAPVCGAWNVDIILHQRRRQDATVSAPVGQGRSAGFGGVVVGVVCSAGFGVAGGGETAMGIRMVVMLQRRLLRSPSAVRTPREPTIHLLQPPPPGEDMAPSPAALDITPRSLCALRAMEPSIECAVSI